MSTARAKVFDGVILGTGYKLSLPFLSDEIAKTLHLGADGMDLHDHTLHPDLDGLAFVGLYPLIGPYFPVLELQARWLTYLWAGLCERPSRETLEAGVAFARSRRGGPRDIPMHALATHFASNAGVEPRPSVWPELERALWFGPLSPASFRLIGPDADPEAPTRASDAARAFNAIPHDALTPEDVARLRAVTVA